MLLSRTEEAIRKRKRTSQKTAKTELTLGFLAARSELDQAVVINRRTSRFNRSVITSPQGL